VLLSSSYLEKANYYHSLFPIISVAELIRVGSSILDSEGKSEEIVIDVVEGELDFSKRYDPFATYLSDPINAAHLALAGLQDSPEAVLQFVKRFGPLDWDQPHMDGMGFYGEEYLFRLGHPKLKRIPMPEWPVKIRFRCDARQFLGAQIRIKLLYSLWDAFRTNNYNVMKNILFTYGHEFWFGKKTPEDKDYVKFYHFIMEACRSSKPDRVSKATADCLYAAFYSHAATRQVEPCLELQMHDGVAVGFALAFHVRSLLDAIRLMSPRRSVSCARR
jgi:hypothetical protein